jgi:branched-chain amino acid transport system substrate-binding protein
MIDFSGIIRAIKYKKPDLVYFASYPYDTSGILHAIQEVRLSAILVGGAMVGLQSASVKTQFGELLNGIVSYELFVREPTMHFPGIEDFLSEYQPLARTRGTDPLGYYIPPFTYAAAQILEEAVKSVGSLDQERLAQYLHNSRFQTIVGEVKFGKDGEWETSRILTIQYQGVKGSDLEQFSKPGTQVILHPAELKSGDLIQPYAAAKR